MLLIQEEKKQGVGSFQLHCGVSKKNATFAVL